MDPYFVLWNQDEAEKIQTVNYDLKLNLKQMGLSGKVLIRDLWRQKDIGIYDGEYTAEVPYHGVQLIKVIPLP